MKNKFFKILGLIAESLFRLVYFLPAVSLIFLVAYFLGHGYLAALKGSDSHYHLANISWYSRFFPRLPYWYPLQNAGIVPFWGYPGLIYFLVVVIERLSSLSLPGVYQVLGFLSVPLTALGLYLFAWTRLKNQTVGLIGGVLYILAPIAWTWLFDWGFYTESVAHIFIFPVLIFYDLFLEGYLARKLSWARRLAFLLAVFFSGLSFWAHPSIFINTGVMAGFLTFFRALEIKPRKILPLLKRIFPPFLIWLSLAVFLFSFYIFDFYAYSGAAWTPASDLQKEVFLEAFPTPVDSLLGLAKIPVTNFKIGHRNIVVPPVVWLPAIFGALLALVYSRKVLAFAFLAGLPVILFAWPVLAWFILKIPFGSFVVNHRSVLIFIRVLGPLVAAFGIWAIFKLLIDLPTFWIKKGALLVLKKSATAIFTSLAALGLAGFLILFLANKPAKLWKSTEVRYGPEVWDFRDRFNQLSPPELEKINFQEGKERLIKTLKNPWSWSRPDLIDRFEQPLSGFSDFIQAHKDEEMLRIDVSPFLGGVVQTLNLESDISQVNLYAPQLSLLGPYWGYEQQVFFSENTGNTVNANNLAKWFGIKYLFLSKDLDFLPKYEADEENWEEVNEAGVWQFKAAPELYSWTVNKPVILVIGSSEKAAFETIFRTAVSGAFDYEGGWLVQGKPRVDDYSLKELKEFDTLILFGADYKNRTKAYQLLDQFVKEGGNLLLSTGWQYVDADWELKQAPAFFPVEDTHWTTQYGAESRLVLEDREIGGQVKVSRFSPLSWGESNWGLSLPTIGKRDWARTVLSVEGKPLVAGGQYGQGKVIWLGINLLGHIDTYDFNLEEVAFFGNLLNWLGRGELKEELAQTKKVEVSRSHPDRVEFSFQDDSDKTSTLFWREAYFPNWQATFTSPDGRSQKLKIYKGGPNLMLIRLPPLASGSQLNLEFKAGLRTCLGRFLSLATLVVLAAYLLFGDRFFKPLARLIEPLASKFKKWQKEMRKKEEEDY